MISAATLILQIISQFFFSFAKFLNISEFLAIQLLRGLSLPVCGKIMVGLRISIGGHGDKCLNNFFLSQTLGYICDFKSAII